MDSFGWIDRMQCLRSAVVTTITRWWCFASSLLILIFDEMFFVTSFPMFFRLMRKLKDCEPWSYAITLNKVYSSSGSGVVGSATEDGIGDWLLSLSVLMWTRWNTLTLTGRMTIRRERLWRESDDFAVNRFLHGYLSYNSMFLKKSRYNNFRYDFLFKCLRNETSLNAHYPLELLVLSSIVEYLCEVCTTRT